MQFVSQQRALIEQARQLSLTSATPCNLPSIDDAAGCAMIFSPHPDDEVIVGALPLRMRKEMQMRVFNVAVTLGSNLERRNARKQELEKACERLGFELMIPGEGTGFENIRLITREERPDLWKQSVDAIAKLIEQHHPRFIFYPHASDAHPTHQGTHQLVRDALAVSNDKASTVLIETEYWSPMTNPNCMIESSEEDVGHLVSALLCHKGEVARNPYHSTLPAWMIDNVRRGSELMFGAGSDGAKMVFATLYRRLLWKNGKATQASESMAIPFTEDLKSAFTL